MKLGFIGCGNMASAMIKGILNQGLVAKENITASAASQKTVDKVKNEFGITMTLDNKEVTKNADVLVFAIKPIFLEQVIKEVKDVVSKDTIILSIVAGKSLDTIANLFDQDLKVVRAMPNTPALVSAGVTAVCSNDQVSSEDLEKVNQLLESLGLVEVIPERLMDAVVAVSGSAPAYMFMFLEAMADAAVLQGMPRQQAYRFAAQTMMGSAKLMLETGKHPGELKDMVCSPAGTTIEAVRVLEEKGLRSAVIEAMKACADKCHQL